MTKLLAEGIKHIEDLKPEQLLDFLSNWNLDNKQFHVSEKVDGNFFGFGLKEGQFYVRSKNKMWTSAEDVPNLFFMQSFKNYFLLLQKIPLDKIVRKLSTKYGFDYKGSIDVEGEAIPSYDHNIVIYDKEKIGDGIFVIFSTSIGGQKFDNPNFWVDLAKVVNQFTSVKVYAVPQVDLSNLSFENDLVVSLRDLVAKHGNFLKEPARKPEEKELKQKLLDDVKKIGMSAKQQVLRTKFQSLFGDEYEGLVIAAPNGDLVKVVEKDKFTQRKHQNWHFIDMLIQAQNNFKKSIKSDPGSIKPALVGWQKELNRAQKDYEKNKADYITIDKKGRDTEDSIDLDNKMIKAMQDMLSSMSPEEVSSKFMNKEIVPEGAGEQRGSFLVKEGGNVFKKTNSAVPKELLDVNIKNALERSALGDLRFKPVGNVNKPYLGDIDIAVDKTDMVTRYGLSDENFWEDLDKLLKDNYKIVKGLNQFHIMSPLVDSSGKQLPAVNKEGQVQEEGVPGFIQIDVFVGNLGWMQKVVSGAPEESKYKAVYRNLFLVGIFAVVRWQSKASPGTYNKLTLDNRNGFKLVQRKTVPPEGRRTKSKEEKISERLFSVDPDVVAQVLFDKTVKWTDIESFEKLYALFNSDKFRFKNKRSDVIKTFKNELVMKKKNIPSELE